MDILKGIVVLLTFGLIAAVFAVGVYLGYESYLQFKAGQILEAIYLVIAASIFLRK